MFCTNGIKCRACNPENQSRDPGIHFKSQFEINWDFGIGNCHFWPILAIYWSFFGHFWQTVNSKSPNYCKSLHSVPKIVRKLVLVNFWIYLKTHGEGFLYQITAILLLFSPEKPVPGLIFWNRDNPNPGILKKSGFCKPYSNGKSLLLEKLETTKTLLNVWGDTDVARIIIDLWGWLESTKKEVTEFHFDSPMHVNPSFFSIVGSFYVLL